MLQIALLTFIDKNLGGGNRYFDKTDEERNLIYQMISKAILRFLSGNTKKNASSPARPNPEEIV